MSSAEKTTVVQGQDSQPIEAGSQESSGGMFFGLSTMTIIIIIIVVIVVAMLIMRMRKVKSEGGCPPGHAPGIMMTPPAPQAPPTVGKGETMDKNPIMESTD